MNKDQIYNPLTPAVFYILLSLILEEKHGYEIMKQVKEDSNNQVKMGPGTLYGTLKRLVETGFVKEAGERVVNNKRRVYYKITESGKDIFDKEVKRYNKIVTITNKMKINNFNLNLKY